MKEKEKIQQIQRVTVSLYRTAHCKEQQWWSTKAFRENLRFTPEHTILHQPHVRRK